MPQELDENFWNENADNHNLGYDTVPAAPKKITPQEYFAGFPEAPFSDTFKWLDLDGFEHMLTIRSWSSTSGLQAVNKAKDEIKAIGGIAPANRNITQAPAPQPDPAAKIALEAGNKQMATELQAQAVEVPPAPAGTQWNVYRAAFVKILPQPDDKVTVEFYGKDRKTPHNDYPELKINKWEISNAQGLMRHVTSADVQKPAEFALDCSVYWLDGKEYTSTGGEKRHYKNVHHVR